MKALTLGLMLSIWPMRWTVGHLFDGETHEWWVAVGPIGFKLYFEPTQKD